MRPFRKIRTREKRIENRIAGRTLKRRMFPMAFVCGTLIASAACSCGAHAHEDRSNFGYCPPPYPPDCVDTVSGHPEARAECDKEVETYVASVFLYRTCLTNETERAVREANSVLRNLKCLEDKTLCPKLRDSRNASPPPVPGQSGEGK